MINYFKDQPNTNIIFIHGVLNDANNPIIFGFGDELDADYLKLEGQEVKGFLHNIKSFWYFKTANYHNLIRYIDFSDFQVNVFGYSCGLSDRTMLNMIFEHENCVGIKIFYHQRSDDTNNYSTLTEEISRHFNDKKMLRRKIIPFPHCSPMPQVR